EQRSIGADRTGQHPARRLRLHRAAAPAFRIVDAVQMIARDRQQAPVVATITATVARPAAQRDRTAVHQHHYGRTDEVRAPRPRSPTQLGVDAGQSVFDRFNEREYVAWAWQR